MFSGSKNLRGKRANFSQKCQRFAGMSLNNNYEESFQNPLCGILPEEVLYRGESGGVCAHSFQLNQVLTAEFNF